MMPGARSVPAMYALKFDDRKLDPRLAGAGPDDMMMQDPEYADVMERSGPAGASNVAALAGKAFWIILGI